MNRRLWPLFALPVCTIVSACNLPVVELGDDRCAARPTTRMSLRINLDPRSPARAWNAADPSGTSDFAHNATVYTDRAEEVTFFYLPVCGRVWQYHAFDLLAVECGSGELEFNEDGELMRVTQLVPLRLTMTTGELAEPIALDYGPLAPSAGQSSSTSNDPNSMVYLLEQDGYEAGAGPDCR